MGCDRDYEYSAAFHVSFYYSSTEVLANWKILGTILQCILPSRRMTSW